MNIYGKNRREIVRGITSGLVMARLGAAQVSPGEPESPPDRLQVGGADLEVRFGGARLDLPRKDLLDWVNGSATAVARYFGRFPVPKARLLILSREGRSG